MKNRYRVRNAIGAGAVLTVMFSLPAVGEDVPAPDPLGGIAPDAATGVMPDPTPDAVAAEIAQKLDALFSQLQSPEADTPAIEAQIRDVWSRSGSASMDLLLQRGDESMAAGDVDSAIGFYSALVDHAPAFAEGYAARAQAYVAAGTLSLALADIQSALALEPRQFEALKALASILEDVGGKGEALEAWQMLQRLTPHDAEVKEALERLAPEQPGQAL